MAENPQNVRKEPYSRKELMTMFQQMKRDCHTCVKELNGVYNEETASKVCAQQTLFDEGSIQRFHMNRQSFTTTYNLLKMEDEYIGMVVHHLQVFTKHEQDCVCPFCIEAIAKIMLFSSMMETTLQNFARSMAMMTKNARGISTHISPLLYEEVIRMIKKEPQECELCKVKPVIAQGKRTKQFLCQDCLLTVEVDEAVRNIQLDRSGIHNLNEKEEEEQPINDLPSMDDIN